LAIDRFAGDIQRLNARREETNCRTRSQNCFGKLRARANEMIAGIENEQQIQSVHLPDLVFAPAKIVRALRQGATRGSDLRLAQKLVARERVCRAHVDNLDRHIPVVWKVAGAVDDPPSAAPKLGVQAIALVDQRADSKGCLARAVVKDFGAIATIKVWIPVIANSCRFLFWLIGVECFWKRNRRLRT
jgi:hypothetical protein